ncbi:MULTISPECIES: thiolase family protein [Lactobacillus]|uniref:thiolase family protein n=1 Tax=Lactobacillus TaxID=1578 RepID=UPI000CDB3880|nr:MULTISPECIES: thiolase family protein [Lactobacillus]MCO6531303.1 thiolase family protein [Lactobacillus sp.]MCO6533071.1 thiolase family protein [Lactobacillus sp.]MCX8735858.1 thiolase family protein [Lactobacillus sp. B4026]
MKDIYVVAAKRTPFGRYRGLWNDQDATSLGELALIETLKSINLDPQKLDALFMGNVLGAGLGQNMARQVALDAGMKETSSSVTVNEVCGSSLKAVRLAQGQMVMGDFDLVAVGGAESMTNAVYFAQDKSGQDMKSEMLTNGLTDAFSGMPMGLTAENIAEKCHISRTEMDEFSLRSHQKAVAARKNGYFDRELIKADSNSERIVYDENIRPDTNMAALSKLKPVFKENGLVTAGNASPLSDGASMIILATAAKVEELGLKPLARLGAFAESGNDPAYMGFAPYFAVQKLLKETTSRIEDFDIIELNEAFAGQCVALEKALAIPADKLNIAGGAIALGHPLAATGTRILGTAINALEHVKGKRALVTLCIGGGQAIACELTRDF